MYMTGYKSGKRGYTGENTKTTEVKFKLTSIYDNIPVTIEITC